MAQFISVLRKNLLNNFISFQNNSQASCSSRNGFQLNGCNSTAISVKSESENEGTESSYWSGAEISLFRVLQPIYVNDYCTIANLIQTKNCKQVSISFLKYQHYQRNH